MRLVYLIRHGESEVNAVYGSCSREERRICGTNTWSGLTEKGIAQSRALGKYLKSQGMELDKVISSTAVRAQQTARYCLNEMGYDWPVFDVDERATELSQGEWEGKNDLGARTENVWAEIKKEGWRFRPPQGESQNDVYERAYGMIVQEILCKDYESAAVFTHKNVIACILTALDNLDTNKAHKIEIAHTSMTILTYTGTNLTNIVRNMMPHAGGAE